MLRCAEFVPLPLFFYENGATYNEKEVLTEKYLLYAHRFLPLVCWAVGGSSCVLLLQQSEQTFQPEDAGWLSWERLRYSQKEKGAETWATPVYLGVRLKNTQQPDFQQW